VMLGLVESWERVIPAPATRANAVELAVLTVPLDAPPATVVIEYSTD